MSGAPSGYLAVDAGNSKTVALVVNAAGEVLGRGRSGRGDIYGADSPELALDAVFDAVLAAVLDSRLPWGNVRAGAFRLAGVDFEEDRQFWVGHVRRRFPGLASFTVKNDAFASLRLLDGEGVCVGITVGTGPAVAARSADGREECSGMFVFDDLGGGGLGNAALKAVCRAWMGIGPVTSLTGALCALYDVPDGWHLRHLFNRRFGALPTRELWRSARLVLAAADAGDAVARSIVTDQAVAFVRYAGWCAHRVGVDLASGRLPVLLNGSVVTSEHAAMRNALADELRRVAPAAQVHVATASPLSGVVLDALAEGGVPVGPPLLTTVNHDHPGSFLLT